MNNKTILNQIINLDRVCNHFNCSLPIKFVKKDIHYSACIWYYIKITSCFTLFLFVQLFSTCLFHVKSHVTVVPLMAASCVVIKEKWSCSILYHLTDFVHCSHLILLFIRPVEQHMLPWLWVSDESDIQMTLTLSWPLYSNDLQPLIKSVTSKNLRDECSELLRFFYHLILYLMHLLICDKNTLVWELFKDPLWNTVHANCTVMSVKYILLWK